MTRAASQTRGTPDGVLTPGRALRGVQRRLTPVREDARRHALRIGRRALGRKEPAHMLHAGKTGGTAIKSALEPLRTEGRYNIKLHEHPTTLKSLPRGEKVFIVLRDPVERYVSAFNSRLREGRPRYELPWIPSERIAFEEFTSPDELACALSDEDADRRARAIAAMSSIQHVRDSYWRWLIDGAVLQRRRGDLLLVMWLPDLAAGFSRLCGLLELPGSPSLPSDDVKSHRSPAKVEKFMSEQAVANLRWWYARDYGCIELCSRLECFAGPSWTSAWPTGASATADALRPASA